ncbi:RagB/SusD family nutrient uptake outer membrane protein [Algoriphagus sp. D3-2-R+10]|uniref:RagB/SusD family nutrient uptake outer membrane protein n=1 Tax=Algoriphagus aurantiacus TaxID=3103948 RepID=UPI002B3CFA25|nr:RagB/SusD family nutrient uptake outer membrane protein [Algoriphagus sp. D3-2-R+10]MEB2778593.1 RagB/SusD family nutrient uptake outer membrane protein [Algoriphagus sp. D3-2-R+10]
MKQNIIIRCLLGMILVGTMSGCEGFLDPKPDNSLVVPSKLEDIRALLDNTNVFNKQPVLTVHAGDEFFITEAGLSVMSNSEVGSYYWLDDPYQGDRIDDWFVPYQQVFYANVALDGLETLETTDQVEADKLRGEALFHRAHAYYQLLQQFAPAYQKDGGNGGSLGIVLKTNPDINEGTVRSDLETCYQRVLDDLQLAVSLLPDNQLPKTRPTKASALGILARVHLVMFNYPGLTEAALSALEIYKDRFDFNELDISQSRPFVIFGEETVFYSELVSVRLSSSPEVFLDTLLLEKYGSGDLRFPAFFDSVGVNRYLYRGRLTGNFSLFGGLGVGELELLAAEGLVRTDREEEALEIMGSFLSRRMQVGITPDIPETGKDLLGRILEEREKELVGRGLRYSDLRRLNQEPEFSKTIKRTMAGEMITLEPESNKYVFPIPQEEIQLSGIVQNER